MRIHFPRSLILLSATVMLSLVLAACGSGGGGGSGGGSTSNTVTLYYPSGRVMAVGDYAPGTTTRTGEWKEYFDENGSPLQWRKNYANGSWDQAKDWREWNTDGSIRNDASDL
jgi:hypothetical protein